MSALLARQRGDRRADARRLAVGIGALLLASAAWHLGRAPLIRALARSSVGWHARTELIRAAVQELYPHLPPTGRESAYELMSWPGPPSPVVAWRVQAEARSARDRLLLSSAFQFVVGDGNLDQRGLLWVGQFFPWAAVPGDRDHDGRFEATLEYEAVKRAATRGTRVSAWGVVRLGERHNEVAGVVVVDGSGWVRQLIRIKPRWRDGDGDGREELEFATVKFARRPDGTMGFFPSQTVAVLEWSGPGGVLRPRVLPDDGSFLVWTPADGRPLAFGQDEVADEVFRRLLPVPEGFGAPPASPTATVATSAPATQTGPSPATLRTVP